MHVFIQEGTTKNYPDVISVLDRIEKSIQAGERDRKRAILAGNEETFRKAYQRQCNDPVKYSWMLVYPGD